jgi:hypothetical protein
MKKIIQLAVVMLSTTLFLTSCKNASDPESIAKEYVKALNNNDFKKAAEFCDENTAKLMTSLEQLSKLAGSDAKSKDKSSYEFVKSDIKSDIATIFFKDSKTSAEMPVIVKKVDGKWKVSMNKEGLGGGSTSSPMEMPTTPQPTETEVTATPTATPE